MAHLIIECSQTVAQSLSLDELCNHLHRAMVDCGIFPIEGIRVRAYCAQACAIADLHAANGFVALTVNVGHGRAQEQLSKAGDTIFAAAQGFLTAWRADGYFALSLELREIDPVLTWKENTIRPRLRAAGA